MIEKERSYSKKKSDSSRDPSDRSSGDSVSSRTSEDENNFSHSDTSSNSRDPSQAKYEPYSDKTYRSAVSDEIDGLISSTQQIFSNSNLQYIKEIRCDKRDTFLFAFTLSKDPVEKNNDIFKSLYKYDRSANYSDQIASTLSYQYHTSDYNATDSVRPATVSNFATTRHTNIYNTSKDAYTTAYRSFLNSTYNRLQNIMHEEYVLEANNIQ